MLEIIAREFHVTNVRLHLHDRLPIIESEVRRDFRRTPSAARTRKAPLRGAITPWLHSRRQLRFNVNCWQRVWTLES